MHSLRQFNLELSTFTLAAILYYASQSVHVTSALENGLALTPPMGWMSWERFRCVTDCLDAPDDCLNEKLIVQTARLMAEQGYANAGYVYLVVDDCWLSSRRSASGVLMADSSRFPSGIRHLSAVVHNFGLKFGLYEDYGNFTCSGYPGLVGHVVQDAETFASWGVDYVKIDGCYWPSKNLDLGYCAFGLALNNTGRHMVYSCSWPTYQHQAGVLPDYDKVVKTCNLWRSHVDVQDSWKSVLEILDFYAGLQDTLAPLAGPGHWNDPDMLIVGNFGLSLDQARAQMALWSILAAPLLLSADLRTIRDEFKEIVLNAEVIKVDQDPMGVQGRRIYAKEGLEVWTRPVVPTWKNYKSYAIVFLNRRSDGTPSQVTALLEGLGLYSPQGYQLRDLYKGYDYENILYRCSKIKVRINPTGVVMLKATVISEDSNNFDFEPETRVFTKNRGCDIPLPHIQGYRPQNARKISRNIRS